MSITDGGIKFLLAYALVQEGYDREKVVKAVEEYCTTHHLMRIGLKEASSSLKRIKAMITTPGDSINGVTEVPDSSS